MSNELYADLNTAADKRFLLGLVGAGPALDKLVAVLERPDFHRAFPRVKVAAWCPAPGADPASVERPPVLAGKKIFSTIERMFTFFPGIGLALDLSGDSAHVGEIRRFAPPGTTLAAHPAIMRFCAAAEDGRLAIAGGERLEKAQSLFGLLVDQFEDDVVILDASGSILDINHHAVVRRNLRREDLLGKHCDSLDAPIEACETDDVDAFRESLATGRRAEHLVTRVMTDGKVRYLSTACFPLVDSIGGRPSRFLYIRRDVTEKQHLEQKLQQAEKMAAIGELSTYMAHEIRNPLFSIGGFANSLLRNTSLNEEAREKARIIFEESRRLDEILKRILNFARPTEQKMGIFNPEIVARQTMELMTIGAAERKITAVSEITPNLPKVLGNAENLKQCLINLVKNAMEAMPDGGTVTMYAYRNDGHVALMVQDTGVGIPPELQDQVFSPFFTTKHGGAGLGLAMSRKMVEEMGGKVYLKSKPGEGTSVILLLPAALAVDDPSLQETK